MNQLNNYNPAMWAQEALMYLRQKTGFAAKVFRGYEQERAGFQNRGDVISFRRPQELVAQDIFSSAPTAQDIDTPNLSLTLDKHQAVHFQVSDKDLAFAGERLISEHVAPAMDAIGQKVDGDLAAAMAAASPFVVDHGGYAADPAKVLATVRQQMVENKAPLESLCYAASPATMTELLSDARFAAYEGAAGSGVATQTSGVLGRKYGFEWHESLSLPVSTVASVSITDDAGAIDAAAGAGATSIVVDGFGAAQDLAGQLITIVDERYLVVSGTTAGAAGTEATLTLATGLRKPVADGDVVTILADLNPGFAAKIQDIVFSPKSTALVVAPLPMHAANMGANVFTAQDPESGLSVRARMNYDNPNGNVNVIFDVLYGIKVLDERQIIRVVDVA